MFTPQKKLWSLTPWTEPGSVKGSGVNPNQISPSNGDASAKGKAVAVIEGDGIIGQLSLTEKISKLENELLEYQYSMGLLLIEKKDWTLKYEELQQSFAEATDTLKREPIVHSIAMAEVEKREENLKKALGVEKQCVLDLEKALHEMRSEHAEIKFNADSKLAEASALLASVDEKSLEVEAKFHATDAKLAELSRKKSEIERKLHELEAQENALRRGQSIFNTERATNDAAISKQKEDLLEWEQKLQEAEKKLVEGRRLLNEREESANEQDNILKEKQNDLEELKKRIEFSNSTLKSKEEDICSRLAIATLKEQEADGIRKRLEEKENQLIELEEKLSTREKLEIQKLVDEHTGILAKKEKEFELEMERKKKMHDEQMKIKVVEVEKKEAEITHMEEKVKKKEQAIEKKLDKLRDKETDFESKLKSLKEREKSLKIEEKNVDQERKQILAEKEDLDKVKAELENLKAETEKIQLKINEEREQLKVTEEEKFEISRLQSELKQEIDKYRFQSEQLIKETDDLKQEKDKFEKEWEELDDRRAEIKKEQDDLLEQKRHFEKLQQSEGERLQKEKLETQVYVQRELEALELAKDSFASSMEHEKSILAEKSQSEKTKMINDYEMLKQEHETEMRRKQEEMESRLHEKEKSFEQERELELNNINYLRELTRMEMEDMKSERQRMEKEKVELSQNKKHVEAQQSEMKKDIEELVGLSEKLKNQREQFINERDRFVAFVEKQKSCNICGETIRDFILSDLQPITELKNLEAPELPSVAENYLKEATVGTSEKFASGSSPVLVNSGSPVGGTISWLRKCTAKILKFSPGKKLELDYGQDATGPSALKENIVVDPSEALPHGEMEPQLSSQIANDSLDVKIVVSNSSSREVEAAQAPSVDQDLVNFPDMSQNSDGNALGRGAGKKGRWSRAGRARSTMAVSGSDTNANAENPDNANEIWAESGLIGTPRTRRKRNRGHESQAAISDNQTEGHSDSIKEGGRPKRRQRGLAAETNISQKRYNLRQLNKSIATVPNGSLPPQTRSKRKWKETSQHRSLQASRDGTEEPGPAATRGDDHDNPLQDIGGFPSEFSADSPFKTAGDIHCGFDVRPADTSVNDAVQSEVNGSAAEAMGSGDGDFKTESHKEEDDSENDDVEVNHPGEASMGKKLWNFLTT